MRLLPTEAVTTVIRVVAIQENGKNTDRNVSYTVHKNNLSMYTTYNLRQVCG